LNVHQGDRTLVVIERKKEEVKFNHIVKYPSLSFCGFEVEGRRIGKRSSIPY